MEEIIVSYGSHIEDFDYCVFNYVNEDLNIFCTTNEGWSKVPVIFSSPERSFSSKNYQGIRDQNGTLIFPIITIIRGDYKKPFNRSSMFGVNQFNQILIHKEINQIKTAERKRSKAKRFYNNPYTQINDNRVIYNLYYIDQPTTSEIDYIIKVKTNFQTQMNEIIGRFATHLHNINYFVKQRNNNKYEGFVDENFKNNSNGESLNEDERFFETQASIKMRGHLVESKNGETPKVTVRESASDIAFTNEIVTNGSIDDYIANLK